MPDRTYTKAELIAYLQYSRKKAYQLITNLTDETAKARRNNESKNYPLLEIILYNMRHVQHHCAQLNLLLRQEIKDAPRWVSVAKPNPSYH